jgi:hypothetical protein
MRGARPATATVHPYDGRKAAAQVGVTPRGSVRWKFDRTRSTYPWPWSSQNSRSPVQAP